MTEPIVFTVRECADLLKVSDRHLRQLIRQGEFPARHLGNAIRIARVDLEAWVAGTWKPSPVRRAS